MLNEALHYVRSGLSIIPCLLSKRPVVTWKPYQATRPAEIDVYRWFWPLKPVGEAIAIVTGAISGNLEVLDFDDPTLFPPWYTQVLQAGIRGLPVVQTQSGGYHVYYRAPEVVGNQKLAGRPECKGRYKTLIETRGEGGYVLAPPSYGYTLQDSSLTAIPALTTQQRQTLLELARSFDQRPADPQPVQRHKPRTRHTRRARSGGLRPGDDYNRRGEVFDVLEKHRWHLVRRTGEETHWRRPGKSTGTPSATFNYGGSNLFFVFSTNAVPFEPERSYSRFGVYAMLEHRGNYAAAARQLRALGYGGAA
jgi:hypothetical protein